MTDQYYKMDVPSIQETMVNYELFSIFDILFRSMQKTWGHWKCAVGHAFDKIKSGQCFQHFNIRVFLLKTSISLFSIFHHTPTYSLSYLSIGCLQTSFGFVFVSHFFSLISLFMGLFGFLIFHLISSIRPILEIFFDVALTGRSNTKKIRLKVFGLLYILKKTIPSSFGLCVFSF